jgi:hypothetical protein
VIILNGIHFPPWYFKGDLDARKDFIQLFLQLKDRFSMKQQQGETEEANGGALTAGSNPPGAIGMNLMYQP